MKLLIITQKVDTKDPVLSFFHEWIKEFSKQFEGTSVICLQRGECSLPPGINVYSLGKEHRQSRIAYIAKFYRHLWALHRQYDAVFVHMNQEYILLAGWLWRLMGKRVFMWRNHHAGSFLTDIAALFCTKVFCTSRYSYTAKYKKTVFMPVGVDLETFRPLPVTRAPRSSLFLARIAPSKRPDLYLEAVKEVISQIPEATASVYGDPLPQDLAYYEDLKAMVEKNHLSDRIRFFRGIPNKETVPVYSAHKVFVNLSSSGMYDKTIFEAMACGCLLLASNNNLIGQISDNFIFSEGNLKELVSKLIYLLQLEGDAYREALGELESFARKHTLTSLAAKLKEETTLQG